MIANATTRLVSGAQLHEEGPPEDGPTPPERVRRKMVGCAVCATKMWEERMRRCYMFRKLGIGEEASTQEEVEEERAQSDASEDRKTKSRGFADANDYFLTRRVFCILAQQTSYRNFWPWRSTRRDGRSSLQRSCARAVCSIPCIQSIGGCYTVVECQFCQKAPVVNLELIFHVAVEWVILTGRCCFATGVCATCATGSPRFHHVLWQTICGAAESIPCINSC